MSFEDTDLSAKKKSDVCEDADVDVFSIKYNMLMSLMMNNKTEQLFCRLVLLLQGVPLDVE